MVHDDFEILARGQFDQLLSLLGSRGKRFLDKDMFSVIEGRFGQLKVHATGVTATITSIWADVSTAKEFSVTA